MKIVLVTLFLALPAFAQGPKFNWNNPDVRCGALSDTAEAVAGMRDNDESPQQAYAIAIKNFRYPFIGRKMLKRMINDIYFNPAFRHPPSLIYSEVDMVCLVKMGVLKKPKPWKPLK